ncbi:hypothetical protein MOD91_18060 [Bacillus haynesii]|uniref:hypothetical protein n=1 Tax=Bacillus haynesii TaxID=1925021 RepID=UPI0022818BBD|nr:hypothetical protein [Bacillus haynesii]MCY8668767.1 hypothetical protein [Bacillus haynesii]MCY9324095.1 hypothetical protein [Bacillus haynesii]
MANIFTKRGQEAKESMNKGQVDLKKIYIRLKEDESVRVRVLGLEDYVEYSAVGDFNLGIYTQPSLLPLEKPDAFDEARAIAEEIAGDDEDHELAPFKRLYPKKRYVFAFADIDAGEIRVWDCSKKQAKKLIKQIEEYKEDINEIAFNFSRTGTKTETDYSLNPILRLKGNDQEKFDKFEGAEVTDDLFNTVLIPRTYKQQVQSLKQAGFPVEEHFDVDLSDEEEGQETEGQDPTESF